MCWIAYHASHEQFTPTDLLTWSVLAEHNGFTGIHSSDHFQPWSTQQGQSGHSFTWLAAVMQACSLPCGLVCAPGARHHPVIMAQMMATLTELYPRRLWIALGSGEAINECAKGEYWPPKSVRNARLLESNHMIRQLLSGERVTQYGHFLAEEAKLYSLPAMPPPLYGAALTEQTAHWMGGWAEGLLTVNHPLPQLKSLIQAYRDGGGGSKPVYVKVHLSYARYYEIARYQAFEQWRTNILSPELLAELHSPQEVEEAAQQVTMAELEERILISSDLAAHLEYLQDYQSLGIDGLILHNVNREQEAFIVDFGQHVLPQLSAAWLTKE